MEESGLGERHVAVGYHRCKIRGKLGRKNEKWRFKV